MVKVSYIESEVNVLDVKFETEEKKYVKFSAVPDGKTLGKRLRSKLASFKKALLEVPYEKMAAIYEETVEAKMNGKPAPEFEVDGVTVNTDEVQVLRELINPDEKKYAGGTDGEVVALVDITSSQEIEEMTHQCQGKLFGVAAEAFTVHVKQENHKSADRCGMCLSTRQHSKTSAELLPTRRDGFLETSFCEKHMHFVEKLRNVPKAVEGRPSSCLSSIRTSKRRLNFFVFNFSTTYQQSQLRLTSSCGRCCCFGW